MCGVSSCLPSPAEKGGTPLSDLFAEVSLSLWIPLGIHTWVQFNLHLYIFKNKTTYLLMMWYSNSFVRDCLILIPSFLTSKGWDIFSSLCIFLHAMLFWAVPSVEGFLSLPYKGVMWAAGSMQIPCAWALGGKVTWLYEITICPILYLLNLGRAKYVCNVFLF